jgi:endo-1,4-beta-xylanase
MIDAPALQTIWCPMVMRHGKGIPLGACSHPSRFINPYYGPILTAYYDLVTPEVAGGYWWVYGGDEYPAHGWADMDKLAEWAETFGKEMHYHCLRWWFQEQPADPLAWISEAMGRYKNIVEWIVVNEGYWDGCPTVPLIERSYVHARVVRPDARLWYNGLFIQESEQAIVKSLVELRLVDAIGIQFHLDLAETFERFVPFLEWLRSSRVPWRVTELDVMIPSMDAAHLAAQAEIYRRVVELVREYNGLSVSMWGVGDADSWQAANYPLPFDTDYMPKPAWEVLVD